MNFSTNAKLATFLLGFFLISLFFVFDDVYGISFNPSIQVSLDKDEYTVGDEPIIKVTDTKKNTSAYTKQVITAQLVTRVTTSTVPVTITTIQLVETNTNSGIFTGKFPPISEQDLVHQRSGMPNKYLSASYTPSPRGQIYSSTYADLVKPLEPDPIQINTGPKVTSIGEPGEWEGTAKLTAEFRDWGYRLEHIKCQYNITYKPETLTHSDSFFGGVLEIDKFTTEPKRAPCLWQYHETSVAGSLSCYLDGTTCKTSNPTSKLNWLRIKDASVSDSKFTANLQHSPYPALTYSATISLFKGGTTSAPPPAPSLGLPPPGKLIDDPPVPEKEFDFKLKVTPLKDPISDYRTDNFLPDPKSEFQIYEGNTPYQYKVEVIKSGKSGKSEDVCLTFTTVFATADSKDVFNDVDFRFKIKNVKDTDDFCKKPYYKTTFEIEPKPDRFTWDRFHYNDYIISIHATSSSGIKKTHEISVKVEPPCNDKKQKPFSLQGPAKNLFTDHTRTTIEKILKKADITAQVSSTFRTPHDQARVMQEYLNDYGNTQYDATYKGKSVAVIVLTE